MKGIESWNKTYLAQKYTIVHILLRRLHVTYAQNQHQDFAVQEQAIGDCRLWPRMRNSATLPASHGE